MHLFPSLASHALPIITSVVAAVLLAAPGPAQPEVQHHLYTVRGSAAGDMFGFAVTGVGDLDRDRHADFCVGAEAANNQTGYIRVFSGATGKILQTIAGTASGDRFGYAVQNAGDVNKDGFTDIIVGAPGQKTTTGYVRVISGRWVFLRSGPQVLHTFNGKATGDDYGIAVSNAGDVDKDGHGDVLIGARQLQGSGYAEVRSGKTGKVLFSYAAGVRFGLFGRSVSNAGDPNRDGYPDAIIGGAALWRVMSGKDGTLIRQTQKLGGKSVSGTGDVDRDGYDDVMVWDGGTSVPKSARVFSGRNWSLLYTFRTGRDSVETSFTSRAGDVNGDGYADMITNNGGDATYPVSVRSGRTGTPLLQFNVPGLAVSGAGDVNRDGVPDVLVGNPGSTTAFGVAHVFSGAKLRLASDIHTVAIATGGTQTWSLDAGAGSANRLYWIFGSVTGTSPGVKLVSGVGSVTMPLNPDFWTDITIGLANTTLLTRTRGTLDASGKGSATFNVPTITNQSAIGVTFHHAYLVYDANNNFHMASNPVPLTLVK